MVPIAELTPFGTTSPRYIKQHAMYLPWRGSHLTIWLAGSKTELVISATESCSWYAISAEMIGAKEHRGEWIRGNGTKFVWKEVKSTFKAPSNRREAVTLEMHWASNLLRLVYVGLSIPRFLRQISYKASLSTMKATSECSPM